MSQSARIPSTYMAATLSPPFRIWCAATPCDPLGGRALRCALAWTREIQPLVQCSLTTASTAIAPAGDVLPDVVAVSSDATTLELDDLGRDVLHRSCSSVLVLRSRAAPRKIVCIANGDHPHLARMTTLVSRLFRAELKILYAPDGGWIVPPVDRAAEVAKARRALGQLEAVLGAAAFSGVSAPRFEMVAPMEEQLLEAVERHEADLVLVGAHPAQAATGALASSLAARARRSVFVVRPSTPTSPTRAPGCGARS